VVVNAEEGEEVSPGVALLEEAQARDVKQPCWPGSTLVEAVRS
jgi:hypothetical protein